MILSVKGLSKKFNGKPVLKDVNFELKKSEILAILGQSGAGKTTILRCLNGLEKCDEGDILIDDEYLCKSENGLVVYNSKKNLNKLRSKLGMVFQSLNLFPHMSVLDNIIEAPITVYGENRESAKNRAMELLDKIGLADKANSYPFELSGGQKQRVAIARACALNPKVMCFDEPTSALDPELREGIGEAIKDLSKEGMSVLIITHDMAFAP